MNIIFIMSDSFRHDNLSCYGGSRVKTPNLDRLAAQSVVFDHAYLGSFPTVPNRLDTMTGRFSCIEYQWQPLPREAVTLQELLGAAGYLTQMIVDTPHLIAEGFNYNRGFDGWEWLRGQENDRWKTSPRDITLPADDYKLRTPQVIKRHFRNTLWWKNEEDRFVARTMTQACRWLEENYQEPNFFLWVDTFDPHEPWDPPKEYIDLYDPGYTGQEPNYPVYGFWKDFLTEKELAHNRACYMGEATLVDTWVGRLLDKVDALGLTENTAILFVSDHGFLIGEHGHIGKSYIREVNGGFFYEAIRMYDNIRRIPLMIRVPGWKGGRHVHALVQTPDLTPTILELAGILRTEVLGESIHTELTKPGIFHNHSFAECLERMHGKSLLPLVRGETSRHRDFVACSNTLVNHSQRLAKAALVTEDGWCLHYSGSYDQDTRQGGLAGFDLPRDGASTIPVEPGLFYLPDDPGENQDVMTGNEAIAREIHARYVRWLEEIGTPLQHLAGRRKFKL